MPKSDRINEADKLLRKGNAREAENILRLLLQEEEQLSGKDSPELVVVLRGLGDAYVMQGKLSEAEFTMLRAIDLQLKEKKGPTEDLAYDMRLLGQTYLDQGRVSDAQSMFALGLDAIDQVYKDDSKPLKLRIELIDFLVGTLLKQGEWAKAEPLLERLYRLETQHRQVLGIADKSIANTLRRLNQSKAAQKAAAASRNSSNTAGAVCEPAKMPR